MEEINELISVIVPVYQVETYLENCIRSILRQSYTNFELILVDDGSKDKCPEICDHYAEKDDRIRVVHKPNGGISSARNRGIEEAKGAWYCFIDGDDYIAEDYLWYLLRLCVDYKTDISCCMYDLVYENGNPHDENVKCDSCSKDRIYSAEQFVYLLVCDKVANYTWNKLFRAALWENIRFDENFKIYEDSAALYKAASKASKIVFGCEIKYYYVQRGNSLLHTNQNIRNIRDYFYLLKDQENFIEKYHIATSRKIPFQLLRLENWRRYLNYCIEQGLEISFKDIPMSEISRDRIQMVQLLQYRDIFDKNSIISNIVLLFSLRFYVWQRKQRNKGKR